MNSVGDNRDEVRRRLQERLQARGVPSGLGTFSGSGSGDKVVDFDPSMIQQLYLLTEDGCPGCMEAMEEFMDDIADGTLKVLDVTSDKGIDIVMALGLTEIPALVIELKGGGFIEFKRP